jgi:putative RecB family exonuclease
LERSVAELDRLFDEGEGLFELNPSKLQCYLDCPRQYKFRYVDKRSERRTFGPTALGRSVHKALRDFYALESAERTLDNLLRALRRAWDSTGYRGQKEAGDAFTRAEEMLRVYHERTNTGAIRVVALESKFSYARSQDGILVTGRIDRLDIDGGEYVIVDYKTGRFGSTDEMIGDSLPLSLYAMATSAVLSKDVSRIAVEHLPTGRRAETMRDPQRLAADWKAIVDIVDEIRTQTLFPPRPGSLCRWCDYLTACPEGQRIVQVPNVEPERAPLPSES